MNKKVTPSVLAFLTLAFLAACSSEQVGQQQPFSNATMERLAQSPAFHVPPKLLSPKGALLYTGNNAPIVRYVAPRGPAARAGLIPGDALLWFNGRRLYTAAEFDDSLHLAPRHSTVAYKRNGQTKTVNVVLDDERPRLGAFFEPVAVALFKGSSPYVEYMHLNDMTIFAETSVNEQKKELHLNLIMQSTKPIPVAQMNYTVTEKGQNKPLAQGFESIDALGPDTRVFSKVIQEKDKLKGPIQVSVNLERNHFHFEFQ